MKLTIEVSSIDELINEVVKFKVDVARKRPSIFASIESLHLSKRANNALVAFGCVTIEDILKNKPDDFYKLENVGFKTVMEILLSLYGNGYSYMGD